MAAARILPLMDNSTSGLSFHHAGDLTDSNVRARLSSSGIKGFLNIANCWKLNEAQARALLGGIASSTFHAWKSNPEGTRLTQDALTRISLILGIYQATHLYFGEEWADTWVMLGNRDAIFGGRPPIDFMIRHGLPGLLDVRRMLDGWRGGH